MNYLQEATYMAALLGTILTLIGAIIGVAIKFANMSDKIKYLENHIKVCPMNIEQFHKIDNRVSILETNFTTINRDVSEIKQTLKDVDNKIDKLFEMKGDGYHASNSRL